MSKLRVDEVEALDGVSDVNIPKLSLKTDLGSTAAGKGAELVGKQSVASVFDLVSLSEPTTDGFPIHLNNFYSDADGGGGDFYWDASRDQGTANGGTIIDPNTPGTLSATALGDFLTQQGVGSGSGCWVRITQGTLSPEMFGITDTRGDAYFLFRAADALGLEVVAPEGTFLLSTPTAIGGISISGAGAGRTIFDATGITDSAADASLRIRGTTTTINHTSSLDVGVTQITWDQVVSVSSGDVIFLQDATSGSWSGHRAAYTKREFAYVEKVSAGTIYLDRPLIDSYGGSATVSVFDNTCRDFTLRGFTVRSKQEPSGGNAPNASLEIFFASSVFIEDVEGEGSANLGLHIVSCFDITGSRAQGRLIDTAGVYPLKISGSQNIRLPRSQGLGGSVNHAIDIGGGGVSRFIEMPYSSAFSDSGWSLSLHGNAEYCNFDHSICSGLIVGGDNNSFKGCVISQTDSRLSASFKSAVRGTELLGTSFDFTGCKLIIHDAGAGTRFHMFDFGQSGIINSDTTRGGKLNISEVTVEYDGARSSDLVFAGIKNTDTAATNMDVVVVDNRINMTGGAIVDLEMARFGTGVKFGRVLKYNNHFTGTVTNGGNYPADNYNDNGLPAVDKGMVLSFESANNENITAGGTTTAYTRSGRTEIVAGSVFGELPGLSISVDGTTVMTSISPSQASRGQDAAGDNFGIIPLPRIYAMESITVTVENKAASAANYGWSMWVREY